MLLTVHTLPQLAVSAKLLCLLMMVICGAVPSVVRSVRLYNECSHGYVQIDANGTVRADNPYEDRLQNLSISSLNLDIALKIYGEASGMYLCFNKKWKLVGKKKFVKKRCTFKETLWQAAYTQYQSAFHKKRFMGFTSKGRPVRGACDATNSRRRECGCCSRKRGCGSSFMFLRPGSSRDIDIHNDQIRHHKQHSSLRQRPSS
ncbi:fibroblast growth factor 8 [Schistocerca americana]|uniref:fibroblast growth factor 8 n=1 Tax=Schistocerca americana TaxID=7009 RepID=UPI001F4FA518|nr:fibroblast growth factor 8 [Schistocerca americana]XP_049939142.1 fibroblast growth factor 8-like [Schistocerca serialis cubense]